MYLSTICSYILVLISLISHLRMLCHPSFSFSHAFFAAQSTEIDFLCRILKNYHKTYFPTPSSLLFLLIPEDINTRKAGSVYTWGISTQLCSHNFARCKLKKLNIETTSLITRKRDFSLFKHFSSQNWSSFLRLLYCNLFYCDEFHSKPYALQKFNYRYLNK